MLALAAFGFRKGVMLFFRFPGAILLPMFTPFTFGPVIGSCSPCCSCCRTSSDCECKLAKSPMELSFTFTYVNVIISAIGGAIFSFVLGRLNPGIVGYPEGRILVIVLPVLVGQFIFIGIFHLFEKKCLCCCNFCLPFTKRETFDIGDAPAWRDAMTDLSHVHQDTPDPRVEVEAIELENLGKGGLILKGIYFQFGSQVPTQKSYCETLCSSTLSIFQICCFFKHENKFCLGYSI